MPGKLRNKAKRTSLDTGLGAFELIAQFFCPGYASNMTFESNSGPRVFPLDPASTQTSYTVLSVVHMFAARAIVINIAAPNTAISRSRCGLGRRGNQRAQQKDPAMCLFCFLRVWSQTKFTPNTLPAKPGVPMSGSLGQDVERHVLVVEKNEV